MASRCERLLVHFDVDVIDFTDVPLSENWGRNQGLPYEQALLALDTLLASPRVAGLTITEAQSRPHRKRGRARDRALRERRRRRPRALLDGAGDVKQFCRGEERAAAQPEEFGGVVLFLCSTAA